MNVNQKLEDAQVGIVAVQYYLYRQAGCPMGDTIQGFIAWKEINLDKPFKELSQGK